MVRQPRCWHLWLIVAGLLSSAASAEPMTVALVSSPKAENLAMTVQAAMSDLPAAKTIQFVERAKIRDVVREQSLQPLADARQAVAIGQLLGAHLFVSLESNAEGTAATGVVIFDAATGARLIDRAASESEPEKIAAALSEAISQAEAKRNAAGTARPMCVVAVRNADLPRAQESVCQAVALLFERAIVADPAGQLLERSRLEQINTERALATGTATGQLKAALMLVDLQISRGDKPGTLKATAFLSHSGGESLGTLTVSGDSPAAIAQQLAAAVLKRPIDEVLPAGSREAEAKRFLQEVRMGRAGVEAAEAALALSTDKKDAAIELAICLAKKAVDAVKLKNLGETLDPDRARESVELVERAIDAARLANINRPNWYIDIVFTGELCNYFDKFGIERLENCLGTPAVDSLREYYRPFVLAQMEGWKKSCITDHNYYGLISMLEGRLGGAVTAVSRSYGDYLDIVLPCVRLALEGAIAAEDPKKRELVAICAPSAVKSILQGCRLRWYWQGFGKDERRRVYEMGQWMLQSPHPEVRYYGAGIWLDHCDEKGFYIDSYEMDSPAWRAMLVQIAADQEMKDPKSPYFTRGHQDQSDLIKHLLYFKHGRGWAFDMLRQSFERKAVSFREIQTAFHDYNPDPEQWPALKKIVAECDVAIASEDTHFIGCTRAEATVGFDHIVRKLEKDLKTTLREQSTQTAVERTAVYVHENESKQIVASVMSDSTLWFCQTHMEDGQSVIELFSWSPGEGVKSVTRDINRFKGNPRFPFTRGYPIAVNADAVFVAVMNDDMSHDQSCAILRMPRNGKSCEWIADDNNLPGPEVRTLAALDDALYIGIAKPGHLLRYDLKNGTFKTLVSAARKERVSPFDNCKSVNMDVLCADPPHNRVVVYLRRDYEYGEDTSTGLWEINNATGQMKKLQPMLSPMPDWSGPPQYDRTFCFGSNGNGIEYNLKDDTVFMYLSTYNWTEGSFFPGHPKKPGMVAQTFLTNRNLRCGKAVWATGNNGDGSPQLGRYMSNGRVTLLPLLGDFRDNENHRRFFKLPDGDVIYVASHGVWRLHEVATPTTQPAASQPTTRHE